MKGSSIAPYAAICILVAACGRNDDATPAARDAAAGGDAATVAAPAAGKCGAGGTACPAGLECLALGAGRQACGPPAVPAVVLIKDSTLGGRCLDSSAEDPFPGASIASVRVLAADGAVSGIGRLIWDQAGYEAAAERGAPPDGSEPTADACTAAYNLGCDGEAVFEIVDDTKAAQPLREGERLVVHLRGAEACGETVADEIEAVICTDPAATRRGNLASCTSRVRIVELPADPYGPDRVGGSIVAIRTTKQDAT